MSSPPNPSQMPPGPPYLPPIAFPGLTPEPAVDDPISGVLLVFFVLGAAFHMTVFQINRRRDHKFILSAATFGFCMARIVALVLRIVYASRPQNVSIAIAANVFTAAGVIILFIVNLIFAQRVVRAYHPGFGHNALATWGFRFLFFSVPAMLIMVITATVITFYTLDPDTRRITRDIQLVGGIYLAVLAFLPIPIALLSLLASRVIRSRNSPSSSPSDTRLTKFGTGRLRTKLYLLLFTSALLATGAGYRVGASFNPRPMNDPAWYHHRAAYYCFNYVIEIIVVYTYGLMRFDRRFHIRNGNQGGQRPTFADAEAGVAGREEKRNRPSGAATDSERSFSPERFINTEAEAFGAAEGDQEEPFSPAEQARRERRWEGAVKRELRSERLGTAV